MERIFPFLWHHGESFDQIREEIDKIYECGLRAFCVEPRPHPDFCGDLWWKDMGDILEYAKEKGMQVWMLDEVHYPSGRANGKLEVYPELKQENVVCCNVNVVGEIQNAKILLPIYGNEERFISALAFPLDENGNLLFDGSFDLTDKVYNNVLYWDVPKGAYRIIGVYATRKMVGTAAFVDPFNPKSTHLIIDEIYQPHFEHYSKYFGNTFRGFFADEPRLGNGEQWHGIVEPHNKARNLGVVGMAYNWHDDLIEKLNLKDDKRVLASLWFDIADEKCYQFRVDYMNALTDAYAKNYSDMIGEWCRAHGVMFTGHVIEDVGAHARTMVSGGHYFKSMRGQDIAGIDIVYNQLKMGCGDVPRISHGRPFEWKPDFYNYTLAKLASSASRLEKVKAGRAFCEVFGAYGWGLSIAEMKWLLDFMLVRGINHFVPHAFNPMIDDTDSPPYFYNGGANPQFPSFVTLMKYLYKMCEYLNGGKVDVKVAVLYHADAEWSGKKFASIEWVNKYLTENQIEFDIVPDYEIVSVDNDGVHTENCHYKVLISPYREIIDKRLENLLSANKNAYIVANDKSDLDALNLGQYSLYSLKEKNPSIRVYRYEKTDTVHYFVFNEGAERIENFLKISEEGYYVATDEQNGLTYSDKVLGGVPLKLKAGESVLITVSKAPVEKQECVEIGEQIISPEWEYYLSEKPYKEWVFYKKTKEKIDVADRNERPNFGGKIRLKGKANLKEGNALLDFGKSTLGITVTLNGVCLGEKIGAPYLFDTKGQVKNGINDIEIVLTTTLGLEKRDKFTHFSAIQKYGLNSDIKVVYYK